MSARNNLAHLEFQQSVQLPGANQTLSTFLHVNCGAAANGRIAGKLHGFGTLDLFGAIHWSPASTDVACSHNYYDSLHNF
jgi:hypothetical protein